MNISEESYMAKAEDIAHSSIPVRGSAIPSNQGDGVIMASACNEGDNLSRMVSDDNGYYLRERQEPAHHLSNLGSASLGEGTFLTAQELDQRREQSLSAPELIMFLGYYDLILKFGNLTEPFLHSAKLVGSRCLRDYDFFHFLWHKLNENGIHLAVDESGVAFKRAEGIGNGGSFGYPDIACERTVYKLSIPFDTGIPTANSTKLFYDGKTATLTRRKPIAMPEDEAAKKIFSDIRISSPRYTVNVRDQECR